MENQEMNMSFEKVIERASNFVGFDYVISQKMLKTAITYSQIDLNKLLSLNDQSFKHDIVGLYTNFDFESKELLYNFLPYSTFD